METTINGIIYESIPKENPKHSARTLNKFLLVAASLSYYFNPYSNATARDRVEMAFHKMYRVKQ